MYTSNFTAFIIGRKTITVPEIKSFKSLDCNNSRPDCPIGPISNGFYSDCFHKFFFQVIFYTVFREIESHRRVLVGSM